MTMKPIDELYTLNARLICNGAQKPAVAALWASCTAVSSKHVAPPGCGGGIFPKGEQQTKQFAMELNENNNRRVSIQQT